MENVELSAVRRERVSKGTLKQFRREGKVPGVVYGRGKEPLSVMLDGRKLRSVLGTAAGTNILVELVVNGDEATQKETVMFKDIQRDMFTYDKLVHLDFLRVSLEDKIEVSVPLNITGESVGVKEGGVLHNYLREIQIKCLPAEIPSHLTLDVSALAIGDSLHVRDLEFPGEVEILEGKDDPIVTINAPSIVEEEEKEVTEEEEAEQAGEASPSEEQEAGK